MVNKVDQLFNTIPLLRYLFKLTIEVALLLIKDLIIVEELCDIIMTWINLSIYITKRFFFICYFKYKIKYIIDGTSSRIRFQYNKNIRPKNAVKKVTYKIKINIVFNLNLLKYMYIPSNLLKKTKLITVKNKCFT
jgi:hypothetical protein